MSGWFIDGSELYTDNKYVGVHNNSGILTYGATSGASLCPSVPDGCKPYTTYRIKAYIQEDTANDKFDPFVTECGSISNEISGIGCNKDALVMWFNSGQNKSYNSVLDTTENANGTCIIDIKNVDECKHIVISSDNGIRCGGQNFESNNYIDSGFPFINKDPYSSNMENKYVAGISYPGHKIKYNILDEKIPDDFYKGHQELVELYFPWRYDNSDNGKNTKVIGNGAFSGCSHLSAVTFSKVQVIGDSAFTNCTDLELIDWGYKDCKDDTYGGKKETTIGDYAFYNCPQIKSLDLSDLNYLETIGDYAFYGIFKACDLVLPNSLTSIGKGTFLTWTYHETPTMGDLLLISIPSSVEEIGASAFTGGYMDSQYAVYKQRPFKLNWNKNEISDRIHKLSNFGDNCFSGNGMLPEQFLVPNGLVGFYQTFLHNISNGIYANIPINTY